MMKLLFRIVIPLMVLGGCFLVAWWLIHTRPEAELRQPPPAVQTVEATRLVRTNYQVILRSQGTVQARTESTLKPEVSGRVLSVSPSFREGGFFEEGDVLLTLDPSDYKTALVVAEANLKLKESALELEKAQHEQAKENWRLLGDGSDPNPLTLREPQLAEAVAAVESARARLEESRRDLGYTEIRAPYAGRVRRKLVDVGQYVTPANDLASIFAVDVVEVRLPLRNDDLDFIRLPEEFRDEAGGGEMPHPRVVLHGQYGSQDVTWEGRIVRAEGAYDELTRELFVVAEVEDPYARRGGDHPPLKLGQFVKADIYGDVLEGVFVLPRTAVRDDREVLIVDAENRISRRAITPMCRDETHVVVCTELEPGEVLCTTPLIFAADGAQVLPTVDGVAPKRRGPGGMAGQPGPGGKQEEGRSPRGPGAGGNRSGQGDVKPPGAMGKQAGAGGRSGLGPSKGRRVGGAQ